MLFLFQDVSCSLFISEFSKRHPRMLQLLNELENCAVQLDRMNKGAKISNVAGSSVAAAAGVLSIVGLALVPFTAGVSLGLTISGTAMGITSGVNSAVTTFTEIGVNHKYIKKANEVFNSFMSEVESLQKCLNQVISQPVTNIEKSFPMAVILGLIQVGSVAYSIYSLSKDISDAKLIANNGVIVHDGKVVVKQHEALSNVSRVASEVPESGEVALKGTLALSKTARAGFIALNALFLGMDIFFICKDSISLAKGSETEVSQFIRARAALWKSEMDSWKKIHDALYLSQSSESENRKGVLETPFYIK
ncbi:apolipoprotein L4-like [Xenentodon cancila]